MKAADPETVTGAAARAAPGWAAAHMGSMRAPAFQLQLTTPAPGEPQRARIVTDPDYPNAGAALADWERLRASVPASLVALRMVASPVVDRAAGLGAGLRGFRLVSDGAAQMERVAAQVAAMNAAAAAARTAA